MLSLAALISLAIYIVVLAGIGAIGVWLVDKFVAEPRPRSIIRTVIIALVVLMILARVVIAFGVM